MKREALPTQTHQMFDHAPDEIKFYALERLAARTLCTSMGYYGQIVQLKKLVHICFHNQYLDDFLADLLVLRRELNAIGTNFNQAVHRLQKLHIVPENQHWVLINEQEKTYFFRLDGHAGKTLHPNSSHISGAFAPLGRCRN